MFYLYHGTDTQKSRAKVQALVQSLLKKKPDASHFRLDEETFSPDKLAEYTESQGLFSLRYIVVLDHVFENEEAKRDVLERLKIIATSQNIFVILEDKLDSKTISKLEKHAEKTQEFSQRSNVKGQMSKTFNVFALTDALGNRDAKKLWALFQKATRAGVAAEEIHGILFWQIKTMFLVSKGDTKGIKPFVVGKARRFLENFKEQELAKLATRMVLIYHDARRGGADLSLALERFVLSL